MKIYLVGGAVRDKLLNLPVKEEDYVVVGATVNDMLQLGYRQVGKEFPVFLHPKTGDEYALARMERKVKPGYKGFIFDTSTKVSLEEDLERRDLTINAMALDPESGQIIDPYGGQKDLDHKILRHVSEAFAEDPVRILRVGRFYARYAHLGFKVDPQTMQLMRDMVQKGEVDALVAERVWKEFERALGEKNPEKFFELLRQCGALTILFSTLDIKANGIKALTAATKLSNNKTVRFAALLHDQADPKKTINNLCHRYRVPNSFRELALLIALNYEEALNARNLSTTELVNLLSRIDIYRREKRFQHFLETCEAISQVTNSDFDLQWLNEAAQTAKSVNVQALIDAGFTNHKLASELKIKRREKIEQWLNNNK